MQYSYWSSKLGAPLWSKVPAAHRIGRESRAQRRDLHAERGQAQTRRRRRRRWAAASQDSRPSHSRVGGTGRGRPRKISGCVDAARVAPSVRAVRRRTGVRAAVKCKRAGEGECEAVVDFEGIEVGVDVDVEVHLVALIGQPAGEARYCRKRGGGVACVMSGCAWACGSTGARRAHGRERARRQRPSVRAHACRAHPCQTSCSPP